MIINVNDDIFSHWPKNVLSVSLIMSIRILVTKSSIYSHCQNSLSNYPGPPFHPQTLCFGSIHTNEYRIVYVFP